MDSVEEFRPQRERLRAAGRTRPQLSTSPQPSRTIRRAALARPSAWAASPARRGWRKMPMTYPGC